ncbi:MAG: hypothetical protein PVG61_03255 [Dehalococcoidia bacterium]|jgi:hypothetical protein
MLILWIRKLKKNKRDEEKKTNRETQLNEHNENMKKFRQLHKELQTVINKDIIAQDGSILAPIHGVRLAKHSQN